ncbi:MAG TPA: MarR family transcriptional regulator [Steroidobacteraceae bacterium]|nr:MarR family transcriptional regulator [Steroidobacteraceae bacterium]
MSNPVTLIADRAASPQGTEQLLDILRGTMVGLVRRDGADLSARQLSVFLTCYLQDGPHTVRGLAATLKVNKPSITRALDRLGEFDLARRKVDPLDRRSVLVQRTLKGTAFLRDLGTILGEATRQAMPVQEEPATFTRARSRVMQGRG